ncbi:putative protein isoform X1 [Capsicum chacoense]
MLKTFIREIGSLSNFSLFTCSSSVARESLASELRFAAQQKMVLTNIEPNCIEKSILQLLVFEPVPQNEHVAFNKSDDSCKEHMREDSPMNTQNELKFLRTDLNLLKDESAEYHSGHNVGLKNDDTHAGNPIGVNLSDNVVWQTDGDHIDVVVRDHLSDNVVDNIGKEAVVIGYASVALEATEVLVDVGSIRKNIDDTSVGDKSTIILDDTPVVPRRIRKSAAICESPYVSKFDSGCSNVQGQPTKCIDKGHSRKHIFSIKHPFTISITEPFLDTKLSSFNKFVDKSLRLNSNLVYSESVNNLTNAFDFGVVTIKTKEWFYTLGYAGIPLTDSHIDIDGIAAADSYDIRMDCGIFVVAFAKYMIEGVQIPASLDDIDSIQSRYDVLLWQYGKIKQKQQ